MSERDLYLACNVRELALWMTQWQEIVYLNRKCQDAPAVCYLKVIHQSARVICTM
jgi:hypothetical protein